MRSSSWELPCPGRSLVVGTTYSPHRFNYHEGLKTLAARPGVKDGPSSEEATPLIQAHLCP